MKFSKRWGDVVCLDFQVGSSYERNPVYRMLPDDGKNTQMKTERERLVEMAQLFGPLLSDPDLSAAEIDAAIEELRTFRMHIHAIDYGSAPGYRNDVASRKRGNVDESGVDPASLDHPGG
jgi:hypothetical protein